MDVAVHKARSDVLAGGVNDLGIRTDGIIHVAHCRNPAVADGHTALIDLAGINVDQLAALDNQIRRLLSASHCQ